MAPTTCGLPIRLLFNQLYYMLRLWAMSMFLSQDAHAYIMSNHIGPNAKLIILPIQFT